LAFKFQYNKTEIQRLDKQLAIRQKALPTLKSKETALRVEVKRISEELKLLEKDLNERLESHKKYAALWVEIPDIIELEKADISLKNIAGVKIPILKEAHFREENILYANQSPWVPEGLQLLKKLIKLMIEIDLKQRQFDILNYARKKTTQKVNLYEKVQIPEFSTAILKIKRYLEDAETISKASQKIIKQRNVEKEAAL